MTQAIYLLWSCEYCEHCEDTHQGRHKTDEDLAEVFLTKEAALSYIAKHSQYIDSHTLWCWRIDEWMQDTDNTEENGSDACISPFWRSMKEGMVASIESEQSGIPMPEHPPGGWPYHWWYDRLGSPIENCPDFAEMVKA